MAMDGNSSRGLCPKGWHIPSVAEWTALGAGTSSSSTGTRRMSSNFYVYPGNYDNYGEYESRGPGWYERGKNGLYWTSNDKNSWVLMGTYVYSGETKAYFFWQNTAMDIEYFSIRCVADNDFKPCLKIGFWNNNDNTDNYMCVASGSGCTGGGYQPINDMCGPQLINGGYTVDFYMVRSGTSDTLWLSPSKNPANCSGISANDFQCYGGIKVLNATYSCGGRYQCRGNEEATKKVNIDGNFNVYARLMDAQTGKVVEVSNTLRIDNFQTQQNNGE
jgi:hypothetical protein